MERSKKDLITIVFLITLIISSVIYIIVDNRGQIKEMKGVPTIMYSDPIGPALNEEGILPSNLLDKEAWQLFNE